METGVHVAVTDSSFRLWHALRSKNGSWTRLADVEGQTLDMGDVITVALAGDGYELHLVATTLTGRIWHSLRHQDGSWTHHGDVKNATGGAIGPVASAAIAMAGGDLHVAAITTNRRLYHAIRYADTTWSEFGNVEDQTGDMGDIASVALAGDGGDLHLAATNVKGELWHTIRYANKKWTLKGDVVGQVAPAVFPGRHITLGAPLEALAASFDGRDLHVSAVDQIRLIWEFVRYGAGPQAGEWFVGDSWSYELSPGAADATVLDENSRRIADVYDRQSGERHQLIVRENPTTLVHRIKAGVFSDVVRAAPNPQVADPRSAAVAVTLV